MRFSSCFQLRVRVVPTLMTAAQPRPRRAVLRCLARFERTWGDHSGRRAGFAPPTYCELCACGRKSMFAHARPPSQCIALVDLGAPLIASYIENKKAGVALQGHSGQKTSFTGTAINGEWLCCHRATLAADPQSSSPGMRFSLLS